MFHHRTPKSIKAYNWFKLAGTLILICIFTILLLRQQRAAVTAPVIPPPLTETVQTSPALPTPKPSVATPTLAPPQVELDEPAVAVKAPVVSVPEIGVEGSVRFSGTGTPGSLVEVCAGDTCLGHTTVGADGGWTFTVQIEPGDYDFGARAVDASGAMLAESPPFNFVVPAPKQAPTLTAPPSGALIAGNLVTLAGTGTPGVEIEILDQGTVVSATLVRPDGTWTLDCLVDSGLRLLSVQNAGEPERASEAVAVQVAVAPISIPDDLVCGEEDIPMGIDHGTVYVVAPCEYFGLIAARAGVKLADLLAANSQVTDPDRIDPGQILNLPPR
jgi:hypothetical protein